MSAGASILCVAQNGLSFVEFCATRRIMAKLPALISALDLTSYRERSTIEHIARVVREAALIPTTKRGPGAADMGVREAANLLLGVAASDIPRAAPETITSLRALSRWGKDYPDRWSPAVFAGVREAVDFGSAMEALIGDAASIAVYGRQCVNTCGHPADVDFIKLSPEIVALDEKYNIRVKMTPHLRMATIDLPYMQDGYMVTKVMEYNDAGSRVFDRDPFQYGRIKTRVEIGLVPIFKLWAALNGMPHANGPTELSL